ncbi:MAG: 3'(2'),5'-bisphosphate nucleotidase [Coxiella sp. RIFCSPHIGHO2_12_FULL_42_15]|nr:MAG: 3'(2'),5'-bisphosphate nucleotidase [Coxiella sp. RIFCSPHIGHO2_12_FULL_42_15]
MNELLHSIIEIAEQAGNAILHYYGKEKNELAIQQKIDKSPLTVADLAAHAIILQSLKKLTPEIPVLSEEGDIAPFAIRHAWQRYWLVDPLDGTRGFVAGSADFTTNIALIENGKPILGVIYVPVEKNCYYAMRNQGAFKLTAIKKSQSLATARFHWDNYRVILGKHLEKSAILQYFENEPGCHIYRHNSSLKFCWIAESKADAYPRLGQTGEWDTAAGQCIVEEAGGCVIDFSNVVLSYNTKTSLMNPPFVALGDPTMAEDILQFIQNKRSNS